MLIYKVGNIIDATEPILIHGCNAQGVMGSGVAKAIREAFPEAYNDYMAEYHTNGLTLGTVVWSVIEQDDKPMLVVGNAITQEFYGRDGKQYVSYDAIKSVFREVRKFVLDAVGEMDVDVDLSVPQVAIPRIGAGLGGGDWSTIESIILRVMKDLDVVVYDPYIMDLSFHP